ncbi:predicted protein [Nematostella vectensis]|uniref:Thioredoxin-like fold domain-containing protein n=1 Tax=Nematostella vectensis TaxID=45351 RepID=A7S1P7_NEMVE|nr:predicted protein [Nematostella vectensis]|eukprot:XP_001634466.1 predicted protein [Nematostella vectensis]
MATQTALEESKVILHQFPRPTAGFPVANMSPFCLKLECFLRMAKIPYEIDTSLVFSSKKKFPWIEYKGTKMADSQFCIEYLSQEFGVDLDSGLSPEQKAVSTSLRVMLEENTFW